MFTSQPMSKERREGIKRRADKVRDKMIQKADPELMNILKEKGITDIDGSKLEMDRSLGEDWVRYSPEDEEEKIEIDEGAGETSTEIVEPGKGDKPSAKDLIEEFDRTSVGRSDVTKRKGKSEGKKAKSKGKKPPAKKPSTKTRKSVKKPAKLPKRKDVDVINIVEQGVYEIDVEKLLDDGPIVVQKDGSYLLHLPSLFKEQKKGK